MSVNLVTVTVAADSSPADIPSAEGYVIASPSGVQWPDSNSEPIVPMVQRGDLKNGSCTLSLVASDNFSAGVLLWDFIINIRGLATVNVSQVAVNFSAGANQNVWTILQTAGWTPPSMP